MKEQKNTLPTALMAVFLATLIGFSCVMCVNDAFALEAAPLPLLLTCAAASALAAFSSRLKRSWPLSALAAAACLVLILWRWAAVWDSLQAVVYGVTRHFSLAYDGVRVVGRADGEPLWILLVLAALLAWLTAWVLGREGSSAVVLLAVSPVLVLVLMVVDLAPVLWLILLTGGLMILVVSHSTRERSRAEGGRLAWWLVPPTVILLCAVTVLWPPADYVPTDWSEALRQLTETKTAVETRVEAWQQTMAPSQPRWSRELKSVDLKSIGPKILTGRPALRYRTDGVLQYLRGVSLAVYEDSAWKALEPADYEAWDLTDEPLLGSAVMVNTLEIETESRAPQLYTAYYLGGTPEGGGLVDDAYVQNMDRATAYTILYEPSLAYPQGTSDAADALARTVYTQVPTDLRAALTAILAENGLQDASAEEIAAYVKGLGTYDLNTPSLPEGEDFVLYFLLESRRGYCVHFASSAVLLLRAAGIPARYVTGYSVDGPTGQWNQVTEDDAHAWVEYYTDGIGWQPLDPTPADENPQPSIPTEPEDTPPEPEQKPEVPESEQRPTVQTAPGQSRTLPKELLWLLLLPGLLVALVLRRWFGLRYRRSRCGKGHPNRRALSCWRWLVQLSKAGGTPIAEDLLCLAEKAKFSQHTMEETELAQLRQAVEERIQALKTASLGKRLWWQYGLALF